MYGVVPFSAASLAELGEPVSNARKAVRSGAVPPQTVSTERSQYSDYIENPDVKSPAYAAVSAPDGVESIRPGYYKSPVGGAKPTTGVKPQYFA